MTKNQEPKYKIEGTSIVNRASGEAIPDDEPIFIFRARDKHALKALHAYALKVSILDHGWKAYKRIRDFKKFAKDNPERMKEPDTADS